MKSINDNHVQGSELPAGIYYYNNMGTMIPVKLTPKESNSMTRKLRKVGNSVVVTLPKNIVDQAGWKAGDNLAFELEEDKVVIRKEEKVLSPEYKALAEELLEDMRRSLGE